MSRKNAFTIPTTIDVPSASLIGMERHPVALAVDDNRAKTKGADGMFWLNDSAAVDRNASQRVIQPAVGIVLDYDAFVRRLCLHARADTRADSGVLMR